MLADPESLAKDPYLSVYLLHGRCSNGRSLRSAFQCPDDRQKVPRGRNDRICERTERC
jgi:hypothetical protein